MSEKNEFTFKGEKNVGKLERYEWDNIWFEYANDECAKKRVLMFGDSISIGIRSNVNKETDGRYYTDGIATSKSIESKNWFDLIDYVFSIGYDYEIIQFNNGLHGRYLRADKYIEVYEKVISYIRKKNSSAKFFLALTTPAREENLRLGDKNIYVTERNTEVKKLAERLNYDVIDLYSPVKNRADLYREDGIHLQEEGYNLLAKECVRIYSDKAGLR